MDELERVLTQYDYPLSPNLIALKPASPRDSSKLLVYERSTQKVTLTKFSKLPQFLPKGCLLVFNETKVIPARIPGRIPSGGMVEILCTSTGTKEFRGLCERRLEIGWNINLGPGSYATVLAKNGSEYTFQLVGSRHLREIQEYNGTTPLPPYLKHSPLKENERRTKYQAIFAKREGSIAAPTASLHFTKRLMHKLKDAHVRTANLTLHVNLGTFMPLTAESLQTGLLHEEFFEIPTSTLKAISSSNKVIPVGTTALRALESVDTNSKSTRLFIREGYTFKHSDGLITNFHVPRSSLMMLVAALIGREKLLELYEIARRNNFRFLSFGDAMLIL